MIYVELELQWLKVYLVKLESVKKDIIPLKLEQMIAFRDPWMIMEELALWAHCSHCDLTIEGENKDAWCHCSKRVALYFARGFVCLSWMKFTIASCPPQSTIFSHFSRHFPKSRRVSGCKLAILGYNKPLSCPWFLVRSSTLIIKGLTWSWQPVVIFIKCFRELAP